MIRHDQERVTDSDAAIEAMGEYVGGGDPHIGVVDDACRARLMEIGEARTHIDPDLLADESDVTWNQIARMRDVLVYHHHGTDLAVVASSFCMGTASWRVAWRRCSGGGVCAPRVAIRAGRHWRERQCSRREIAPLIAVACDE